MTLAILVLFTLSGLCALAYQLVWTRWLGLLLGNFATATCLVVATFMGGLAIGNALAGRLVARRSPPGALRAYGLLEAGLAILAAVSPLVLSTDSPLFPALASATRHPLSGALACVVLLLPPTILMGATLPALVQTLSAGSPAALGPLYSLNTLGGAMGPLLAAFLLLPVLGLKRTMWACAALNIVVAAGALWLARRREPDAVTPAGGMPPERGKVALLRLPFVLAALSGFLALGFEVALTRLFVLTVTGSSVYGLAIILSAFLTGLALGAMLVRLIPPRDAGGALLAFALALTIPWFFSLSTPFWDRLPEILVQVWWKPLPFAVLNAFNFAVVFLLTLGLTTAFGYALPALSASLPSPGSAAVGRLFAANTVGAVLGALTTGLVLLRVLGLGRTLLALGGLALLVSGFAAARARPGQLWNLLACAPLLLVLPFALPQPDEAVMNAGIYNRPADFRPGTGRHGARPRDIAHHVGRVVYRKDSTTARIAVVEPSPLHLACLVNGKPDGSSGIVDMHTQLLTAHLPVLAHRGPRSALVIGLGTGITAGSLALHPDLEEVHVVEIEPAQVEVAHLFRRFNHAAMDNPKIRVHLQDARRFLLVGSRTYDLIASEPSNLWVSGMVNLFTREFYELVRRRLGDEGVFIQWLHYYRVSDRDIRGITRTFQSVFPEATFWIHPYGDGFLLGRRAAFVLDVADWGRRMDAAPLRDDLRRLELSAADVPGFFLWGARDLARFAGDAPFCTDDRPYLEFTTPRMWHAGVSEARSQLARMQGFGPLAPAPLAAESAELRQDLGDLFVRQESLQRAEAEYRRALELDPRAARAKRGLEDLATRAASPAIETRK